jgi:hypothetical protein
MISQKIPNIVVSLLISFLFGGSVVGQSITFDSPSDLNQFNLNGNAATAFAWSSTAGVGPSGGVVSTSQAYDSDSAIYPVGFDNQVGAILSVQLDYQMQYHALGPDIRLGFTTDPGATFHDLSEVWIETYGNIGTKAFRSNFALFPFVAFTPGNWFRMELDLTKTGSFTYNGTANLFDLGPTGLAAPTLLATNSFFVGSVTIGSASHLFPGFFVHAATTGVDNFMASSSVPEPSTFTLIAVGIVALVGAIRLRRSN